MYTNKSTYKRPDVSGTRRRIPETEAVNLETIFKIYFQDLEVFN